MIQQTREELLSHLHEQRAFLRLSAETFDRGIQAEAKRLAAVIRTMVHDTGKSRSLLGQLGVKTRLRYHDTRARPPVPGAILIHAGLAIIEIGYEGAGVTRFQAPLDDLSPERRGSPVPFEDWWTGEVLRDNEGNSFARRDLVLGVAHLDGGVHVDPELEESYAALTRANSHGWELFDMQGVLLSEGPVLANVRQIAWELETTMDEQLE
jgi:hypothetical protein